MPSFGERLFAPESVTVGAVFWTVAESLALEPSNRPSFGVTVTLIESPLSPLPGVARLNVSVVFVVVVVCFVVPLTFHT